MDLARARVERDAHGTAPSQVADATKEIMPARNARGRFVRSASRSTASRAIAVRRRAAPLARTRTRTVVVRRAARRARAAIGGIRPIHLAVGAAAISYLAGSKGPTSLKLLTSKIPGTATFGPAATIGLTCLAIDKWVRPNRYLRAAGYAGIVIAAAKIGAAGMDFKYVGDSNDGVADIDIGDEDDDLDE